MPENTVFILSNKPDQYRDFVQCHGASPRYFLALDLLNRALVESDDCKILVVDMHMVMRAPAEERDRLFALSHDKPFIRSRSEKQGLVFLDRLSCSADSPGVCRPERILERTGVRMEAQYADFRDPVMSQAKEGVILDISPGGCFLHVERALPESDYLYLKILDLKGKRPIHCAVRWRRSKSSEGLVKGVGLKFMDISEKQLAEIQAIVKA